MKDFPVLPLGKAMTTGVPLGFGKKPSAKASRGSSNPNKLELSSVVEKSATMK